MRASLATLLFGVVLAVAASTASAESLVDTTPGVSLFVVPAGISALSVSVTGGAGGNQTAATNVPGGRGALVAGTVAVSPGQQLRLTVGTNGGDGSSSTGASGAAGAPDGGAGGWSAGGGGGATSVLGCQGVICSVGMTAAGGGGAGASGGYLFPPYAPLSGGPGGGAGVGGTAGESATTLSGGGGGQPGTSTGPGAGGTGGTYAGAAGMSSTGGAGGNPTGDLPEGGGGGGGGVFGGGGGGSGIAMYGMTSIYSGGGGGGGGLSVAPKGTSLTLAPSGATPGIVLSWALPGALPIVPVPDPSPPADPGFPTAPAVSNLALSSTAFPAAPRGSSAIAAAKRRYGTTVSFALNVAGGVTFTITQSRVGRRAKSGACAKPTKSNRRAHACTRIVALPGHFTRASVSGTNRFGFTGRLGGRRLTPGTYRLVATPGAGTTPGRAGSVSFRIVH
jgi:hypothetical protein